MSPSLGRRQITIGYSVSLGVLVASLICYPVYFVMSYDPSRTAEQVRIGPLFKIATFALLFAVWNVVVFRAARRREGVRPQWSTLVVCELVVALGLALSAYVGYRFQAPSGFFVFVVVEIPVMVLCHRTILAEPTADAAYPNGRVRQSVWRLIAFGVAVVFTVALGLQLISDVALLVTTLVAGTGG